MKNISVWVIVAVLLSLCSCAPHLDLDNENVQVEAVLDQMIKASETEDMELLSQVYAHDDDMVIFGTDAGERLVGWETLKELMQKQFDATENSKLNVRDEVIHVHNSGKTAWFSQIIDWELTADSQTVKLEGLRASGVLEKRNENWVIVQLHYSIPVVSQAVEN
jgi:ketosteroid isomerase-like protein